jgi:hypothetical protein
MAWDISPTEIHRFTIKLNDLKVPGAIELQQDAAEIDGSDKNQFQKRAGNIQRGPVKMDG